MSSNDNESPGTAPPPSASDAHGHAALILVESLLHGLISRSVLTTEDSLHIVESAEEVQGDYVDANHGDPEMRRSRVLLHKIAASLSTDIERLKHPTTDATRPPTVVESWQPESDQGPRPPYISSKTE